MSTLQLKQPIQFLLEQLKKEENQERFNLVIGNTILRVKHGFKSSIEFDQESDFGKYSQCFLCLHQFEQEKIIRTCLSRTKETEDDDGDAIISVFEGDFASSSGRGIDRYDKISDLLGEEFDLLIRHSYSLDEAIDSLGQKMLDLVPEYEEFCKKNNN